MKTRFTLFAFMLAAAGMLNAQAPVPTSWNCDNMGNLPTGWTVNNGTTKFYTSNNTVCEGAAALRMDATGHYLQVNTASQPGTFRYQLGGTGNGTWNGTVSVQESVNGSAWNTLKTYGQGSVPNNVPCLLDSVTITDPNVRYVRIFYTSKASGFNFRVDDVHITAPPYVLPKIAVEQQLVNIINGGYALPFNGATEIFSLKNVSVSTPLVIDSVTFSGTHASDFSAGTGLPVTVGTTSAQSFTLNFNPGGTGTRQAVMHIYSNDFTADSVYDVNLYAVSGALATEPTVQASNLNFSNVKSYRGTVNFNTANPLPDYYGGYIVLRADGAPVSGTPVDGTTYTKGETIGNAKVVYVGSANPGTVSFIPRAIRANSTYHFAVYTYNGGGSNFVNYLTASPLTGSFTSSGSMLSPSYYNGVDPQNTNFVSALQSTINPHNSVFYSNYAGFMILNFEARDTFRLVGQTVQNNVVTCSYSRTQILYAGNFDFTGTGTSREHTFPHSWMPTNPANNPEKPEYNDMHNLYLTRQVSVNDVRCNYPFGEVVNVISQFGEGVFGTDANGNRVYEPSDIHKGRAARSLMYMTACYNTVSGNAWNFTNSSGQVCSNVPINYIQDQTLIKKWHFEHLPDNYDIARNDFVDSIQGNRNPFVDNPDWACYIDFETMTYIASPSLPCATVGMEGNVNGKKFSIFPNPSQGVFNLSFWSDAAGDVVIRIIDITGKTVSLQNRTTVQGNNTIALETSLASGMYVVEVQTPDGKGVNRLIIQ